MSSSNHRQASRPLALILLAFFFTIVFQAAMLAAPPEQGMGMSEPKSEEKPAAKSEEEAGPVPRISMSEILGSPGASLMVPLYYTPDPKQPARSLTVDIEFVSNHLKFQKASRGVIPEEIGADISANVTDGAPDAKTGAVRSKLRVAISLTEKNPQKGLPEGLLSFLLFQVTMDAKPFTIKLNPTVIAAEDLHTPPRKIAKFSTVPGTVVVEIPDILPEATCFFFSH